MVGKALKEPTGMGGDCSWALRWLVETNKASPVATSEWVNFMVLCDGWVLDQ
jgi:hypothetical protein